jgi:hypothetical protein
MFGGGDGPLDESWRGWFGAGERLFEGVGDVELAPAEVVASRAVTHIRYELRR